MVWNITYDTIHTMNVAAVSLVVRPWAHCAGSRHSSFPSLRRRVAAVSIVAAVHCDRPMAWLRCDSNHPQHM